MARLALLCFLFVAAPVAAQEPARWSVVFVDDEVVVDYDRSLVQAEGSVLSVWVRSDFRRLQQAVGIPAHDQRIERYEIECRSLAFRVASTFWYRRGQAVDSTEHGPNWQAEPSGPMQTRVPRRICAADGPDAPRPVPPPAPPPPAAEDEVYEVVEQQPMLIGGLEALQARLEYPHLALRAGIEGRVVVQFIAERDGTPSNVRVVRGVGSGLDEAAVRVVQQWARFTPGMQRGRAVRVRFTLPLTFRLR